jgi:hypothetical protein
MILRPLPHIRSHRGVQLLLAGVLLAVVTLTVGGRPRTADAQSNCNPHPQFIDCLTPPLLVTGAVQGSTLTLSWSYDPAVRTDGGRPHTLIIRHVGVFNVNTDPAYSEAWNTGQPRTSFTFAGLSPGEHYYRVCLIYHTIITYTDGSMDDAYPELCPSLPAGGTVSGGGSGGGTPPQVPPTQPALPSAPTNVRVTNRTATGATLTWWHGTGMDYYKVGCRDQADGHDCSTTVGLGPRPDGLLGLELGSTHTFVNLQPSHTYVVRVCSERAPGDYVPRVPSACSADVTVRTLPPQPTDLHARINTGTRLELVWTTNVPEASWDATTMVFDVYRDGTFVRTVNYWPGDLYPDTPGQEGSAFVLPLTSFQQAVYKVCAVDRRGMTDLGQNCSANHTVRCDGVCAELRGTDSIPPAQVLCHVNPTPGCFESRSG